MYLSLFEKKRKEAGYCPYSNLAILKCTSFFYLAYLWLQLLNPTSVSSYDRETSKGLRPKKLSMHNRSYFSFGFQRDQIFFAGVLKIVIILFRNRLSVFFEVSVIDGTPSLGVILQNNSWHSVAPFLSPLFIYNASVGIGNLDIF